MARIRTTKPEFFTSEQVMNLSIHARFAFLGMWNFCDDGGNHPASPKTLKAEVFPSDDVTSIDVQGYVDEMIAQGLIAPYEASGKQYWHVTGWHHQRIDKPTLKHPPFSGKSTAPLRLISEASTNDLRDIDEDSSNDLRDLDPGMEGNGREGKGEEEKTSSSAAKLPTCPVDLILDEYRQALPDLPPIRLMPEKRRKAIAAFWRWVLTSTKTDGSKRAQTSEEAIRWIAGYFERASQNDFLMGRTGRSDQHANWTCNLDFLLTEKGKSHVIEKTLAQPVRHSNYV
jgi:hypothetical protein